MYNMDFSVGWLHVNDQRHKCSLINWLPLLELSSFCLSMGLLLCQWIYLSFTFIDSYIFRWDSDIIEACSPAAVQTLLFFGGPSACVMHCRWQCSGIQMRHKDTGRSFPGGENLLKHLLPVVTWWLTIATRGLCLTPSDSVAGGEVGALAGPDSAGEPHANVTVARLKGQSVYL